MHHGQWKEKIEKISSGVLSTASDLLLLHLFIFLEGIGGGRGGSGIAQAFDRAWHDLESYKAFTPATTARHLTFRGRLKRLGKDLRAFRITATGRKRISELFPTYKSRRPWDGKIYLITYDIPEKRHDKRNLFRDRLQKLGCGMIQASVWVTPYYPRKILRDLIDEHDIPGSILVSDLGEKGSIGEQSLEDLIRDVYKLHDLEHEYAIFIQQCKKGYYQHPVALHCAFARILKGDPQLPFALLTKPWIGTTAYHQCQSALRSLLKKRAS